MGRIVTTMVLAVMLAAMLLLPRFGGGEGFAASGYAGHWHVTVDRTCIAYTNNAQFRLLCEGVFHSLIGVGTKGTRYIDQERTDYVVDGKGRFTAKRTDALIEHVPGAPPVQPRFCIFPAPLSQRFNGTCRVTFLLRGSIGKGSISQRQEFLPTAVEVVYANGQHFSQETGEDVPHLAAVGDYGINRLLDLIVGVHVKSIPRGYILHEVVKRAP